MTERLRSGNARPASLPRVVRPLRLNLKGCYFDAIRDGKKTHEYRLEDRWQRRLEGREFTEIHLLRGYPKRGDESRILRREWRGYTVETLQHPHFGPEPVRVLSIDVTGRPDDQSSSTAALGGNKCNQSGPPPFAGASG